MKQIFRQMMSLMLNGSILMSPQLMFASDDADRVCLDMFCSDSIPYSCSDSPNNSIEVKNITDNQPITPRKFTE